MDELFVEEVYRFTSVNTAPYIIDCGANIGLSIIYFKKLFPLARIVAFEPDKDLFRTLNENIEQFKFENVQVVNKGVWSEETTLSFLAEGTLGGKVIEPAGPSEAGVISIPTVKLKDYLHEKVEFLKIDIEGAEYEVLIDCAAALKNVELLFVEYHSSPEKPQRLDEILAVIAQAGFRYHIKAASRGMTFPFIDNPKQTWFDLQLNIFCYRPESRK
jgi:FkbM family methyltransferase